MSEYTYIPRKDSNSTSIIDLNDPDTPEIIVEVEQNDENKFKEISDTKSERLKLLTETANRERSVKNNPRFFNNLATIYMEILDELNFIESIDDFFDIFLKKNRLMPIGILILSIVIFLMIVRSF
jgi:hypothetical protein